jgi:hypothetical protein
MRKSKWIELLEWFTLALIVVLMIGVLSLGVGPSPNDSSDSGEPDVPANASYR